MFNSTAILCNAMGGAEYELNPEFQSITPYMVCPSYVICEFLVLLRLEWNIVVVWNTKFDFMVWQDVTLVGVELSC